MGDVQTTNVPLPTELARELEAEAAKLNLSLPAYIYYLRTRLRPGADPERLDRHVKEVFGKHGELIRRLAK